MNLVLAYSGHSVSVRLPNPKGGREYIRLLRLRIDGRAFVNYKQGEIKEIGLDEAPIWDMVRSIAGLFPDVDVQAEKPRLTRMLKPSELHEKCDDILEILRETVEQIREEAGS